MVYVCLLYAGKFSEPQQPYAAMQGARARLVDVPARSQGRFAWHRVTRPAGRDGRLFL
jgi:hypothetical protein